MLEKAITGNTTTDITVSSSTKALVFIVSANYENNSLFFISATSAGVTRVKEIEVGTNLSITTGTNKASITNNSPTNSYAYAIIFDGNGMS